MNGIINHIRKLSYWYLFSLLLLKIVDYVYDQRLTDVKGLSHLLHLVSFISDGITSIDARRLRNKNNLNLIFKQFYSIFCLFSNTCNFK